MADVSAARQLDGAGEGDHPPVAVVGVLEEVLHMRGGEVQVFDLAHRAHEPVLPVGLDRLFQDRERGRGHEPALVVHHHDADEQVAVGLIEQVHLRVDRLVREVDVLDDAVIHRVRDAHHIAQVGVEVHVDLLDDAPVVLLDHLLGRGGEAQVEGQPQEDHPHHRHDRKGDRDHVLDAALLVGLGDAPEPLPNGVNHVRPPGCCGIWSATCRTAF